MIDHKKILITLCLPIWLACSAASESGILVIKGGDIYTISGEVISKGVVLIENGKILSVGKNLPVPENSQVIDAGSLIVTPGIIDARSAFGLRFSRKQDNYLNPARKIVDSFSPVKNHLWLKCGVTATYVTPPAQDLLGGFGGVVKLTGTKEDAVVREAVGMSVSFGESARTGSSLPTTRQGRIGKLRQQFIRAQEYKELKGKKGNAVTADPGLEALLQVLNGDVPLRIYVNNPDDIMAALRLAQEFKAKLVIDSGAGAHRVAHLLAKAKVPVVVGPNIMGLGGGGPMEMYALTPENAARLHQAGVKLALSTDSRGGRSVLLEGLNAKSHGLPEEAALRAVTLGAAEILGVADRLGSIEPGKDADIVIWKGHPLNTWGETQMVIIDGKIVFQREN